MGTSQKMTRIPIAANSNTAAIAIMRFAVEKGVTSAVSSSNGRMKGEKNNRGKAISAHKPIRKATCTAPSKPVSEKAKHAIASTVQKFGNGLRRCNRRRVGTVERMKNVKRNTAESLNAYIPDDASRSGPAVNNAKTYRTAKAASKAPA